MSVNCWSESEFYEYDCDSCGKVAVRRIRTMRDDKPQDTGRFVKCIRLCNECMDDLAKEML